MKPCKAHVLLNPAKLHIAAVSPRNPPAAPALCCGVAAFPGEASTQRHRAQVGPHLIPWVPLAGCCLCTRTCAEAAGPHGAVWDLMWIVCSLLDDKL